MSAVTGNFPVNEIKVEIKEPDNEESNDSHFMMFNKKDKESD